MSRRREYIKANQFDSSTMAINCFVTRNDNGTADGTADVTSSEIIELAAKLFYLSAKRGRVKSTNEEVFDEAV